MGIHRALSLSGNDGFDTKTESLCWQRIIPLTSPKWDCDSVRIFHQMPVIAIDGVEVTFQPELVLPSSLNQG
jgi:hypothetical protein